MTRMDLDSALAGFLLPAPLISAATLLPVGAGAFDSSFTESSPVPGVGVYQYGSIGRTSTTAGDKGPALAPQLVGEQVRDIEVMVTRAGMPGAGCEVAVRRDMGDDGLQWFGRSTDNVLQQTSAAALNRGIDGPHNWAGVDLENGEGLVVWNNSGVISGRRYDTASHDWVAAAVVIADQSRAMDADGAQPAPASYTSGHPVDVLRLPTGRLLVAAFVLGPGGGVDLVVHYSDDDSLTWRSLTLAGYDVELPVGATYDSIAWHHSHELVLLLVGVSWMDEQTARRGWVQYASADIGHSFDLVETWNESPFPAGQPYVRRPDITATPDGVFVVAYLEGTPGTALSVQVRRIASPYLPLRQADAIDIMSGSSGSIAEDVTCWCDTVGVLHVAWSAGNRIQIARSYDGGVTWDDFDTALTHTPGALVDRFRAIPIGSRVLWTMQLTASGARPAQWLALLESGGWTMVPMPRTEAGHPLELRGFGGDAAGFESSTWWPVAAPTIFGWTLAGTAGSISPSGDWALSWSSATGEYQGTYGSHSAGTGIDVHFEAKTSATPADTTVQGVGLEVGVGNGAEDLRVDVRLANGEIGIYDTNNAGAVIGSAVAFDCTVRRVYRVALSYDAVGNTVALYSRPADGEVWTLLVSGVATRRTVGAGTSFVNWGQFGAHSSTWYGVHVTIGDGFGSHTATTDSLAAGLAISKAPDSLPGGPLPALPNRLHVEAESYLRARRGPGARGDHWIFATDHLYRAANLLSRSPQEEHRTTADNVAQSYVFAPLGGTVEHHFGASAPGGAVFGANYRQAKLQGGDGTTWTDIATLDLADGLTGLSYSRTGDTYRVAVGTTAAVIRPREVIGGTIADGAARYRIVDVVQAGPWRSGSASVVLRVEGAPAGTASGSLDIWRPCGAVVALGYTTAHKYYRWRVAPETTVDGFYRCGRLVVGPVLVLGQRWSKGRATTYVPQVELEEAPGYVASRRRGDMLRATSVSWSEGFPTEWGDDPQWQQAGGVPIAMVGDLSPVETLTALVGGGDGQVVLLPRIEHDPDAVSVEIVQCAGRYRAILGRLSGEPEVIDVDGDELVDAVQRVAVVEHIEER